MDYNRAPNPHYTRQWVASNGEYSRSPAASPVHPHAVKGNKNDAARNLAQAMAIHAAAVDYSDDDDDDGGFQFAAPAASRTHPRFAEDAGNQNFLPRINLPAKSVRRNYSSSPAQVSNFVETDATSVHSSSTERASVDLHTVAVPSPEKSTIHTTNAIPDIQLPRLKLREQRVVPALEHRSLNEQEDQLDAFALYDQLDLLQEENARIHEMLQNAEEKRNQAEARAREIEKQVADFGGGASFDQKWFIRKERDLRQRELNLKAQKQKGSLKAVEIATLRAEIESLQQEAAIRMDYLQEVESEAKALQTLTYRTILTHAEMEEVVLKRCWLARYWGLAVRYDICADTAVSKYEHWSAFAPLPFEVVIAAGQKAKDDFLSEKIPDQQNRSGGDPSGLTKEGNIESMLSVEMGLRELASLKIEDAVLLAMAQRRSLNSVKAPKSPGPAKPNEAFVLNQDELEDVLFKQAWLTYFWNRARYHGVEGDIAEEKLRYWISQNGGTSSHDAADVERGLHELRKLGIEQQLWEASRREITQLPLANGHSCNQPQSSPSEASP